MLLTSLDAFVFRVIKWLQFSLWKAKWENFPLFFKKTQKKVKKQYKKEKNTEDLTKLNPYKPPMLSKYLNPRNDLAFKRIFGEERNKDLVIALINAVLSNQMHKKIVKIHFLKSTQEPETAAAKRSIVDILCQDEDGCRYVIEMQVAPQEGFEKRAQYYASRVYTSQMKRGGAYQDLKKVIFLAFVDYPLFDYKKSYKSEHVMVDRDTTDHDLKDFSFTFVNLPKFMARYPDTLPTSLEEKFYYFLCKADELTASQVKALEANNEVIQRAFQELDIINWSQAERNTYDQVEKIERDHRAIMTFARNEGIEKGIEKGKIEILKSLVAQGIITKKEADAQRAFA